MDNKLDELVARFAEKKGIEFEEMKQLIINAATVIAPVITSISEMYLKAFEIIKEKVVEIVEWLEEKNFESHKQSWPVDWDTRKPSQVMMNKPKFVVRKIIL